MTFFFSTFLNTIYHNFRSNKSKGPKGKAHKGAEKGKEKGDEKGDVSKGGRIGTIGAFLGNS